MEQWLVAVVVGLVQGVLEWLPVSSEGSVALVATLVLGAEGDVATQFALFMHAGTGTAAAVFYRTELRDLLGRLPEWRPRAAVADASLSELTFLGVGTATSAVVGAAVYAGLSAVASALTGGAFVAAIGALLVGTGLLQRFADTGPAMRASPTLADAVLVGAVQGLALLPGVSRSGTTVSVLLLRGHDGARALRLSFLLAIPASLGAGALVLLDTGVPSLSPAAALLALAVSGVVGYLTVGTLVAVARRVAFWGVCVGFGALAVVGGLVLVL